MNYSEKFKKLETERDHIVNQLNHWNMELMKNESQTKSLQSDLDREIEKDLMRTYGDL